MSRKKLARAIGVCTMAIMIIVAVTILPSCQSQTPPAYGLEFDGTDDYVDCGNNETLAITDAITIEVWVKYKASDKYQCIIRNLFSFEAKKGMRLYVWNDNKSRFYLGDGENLYYVQSDATIPLDEWTHLAGTWDGTTIKLYVNGVNQTNEQAFSDPIVNDLTEHTLIGLHAAHCFNGTISEVRIWNYARSESEIKDSMYSELKRTEEGLVGYWKLDEGSGTIAYDSSPNGNHGTLYGDMFWLTGGG
jgi:hypothetical protein